MTVPETNFYKPDTIEVILIIAIIISSIWVWCM